MEVFLREKLKNLSIARQKATEALKIKGDVKRNAKTLKERERILELLALRDLPPGAAKRDKTIHFVCSHKRGSAENSTEVAKHLRGATDHLWQGCRMRILPPVNGTAPLKKTAKVKQVIGLLQGEE